MAVSWHTDRDGAEETRRVEAAERRAFVTQADVSDPTSVRALFGGAPRTLGASPDLLAANAGVGMSGLPVGATRTTPSSSG